LASKEDLERFFYLYWDVRGIVIDFQIESPKGPIYASGAIEKIRNGLDDYVRGWLDNDIKKMANAEEHLSMAGSEALEIILLDKINYLTKVGKKLNFFLGRILYPRKVYKYIYTRMPPIEEKMKNGKAYKSIDYYRAKDAFTEGIKAANKVIDEYEMWDIPGMRKAEHRINYFTTALITSIATIIATIGAFFLLKTI
jgi:hypothetical protein